MNTYKQQLLLEYLDYSPGELDGIPGPQTERATASFQAAAGLIPDGVCGAQTEKALKGAVAGLVDLADGVNFDTEPEEASWWPKYKNFTRSEFACRCGGQYCNGFPSEPKEKLVALAQKVRDHYGKPVHRVSGLRCPTWNAHEGGVSNSLHMYGQALDFWISGEDPESIVAWIQANCPECNYTYAIRDRAGLLCGTVHMDVK